MSHYVLDLINNLPNLIAQGGYWLICIIVILEGVPFIGSLLPGHVAIIAAGFLAKMGILSLPTTIIVATIAAIIGDLIGFFAGRRYGYSLLSKFGKYIFVKEEHIEKAKRLIDGHTGKSLIIGRFSPLTRPLTPFLVGASGIKTSNFLVFNILGAFLWIASSVILGYVFGASYGIVSELYGKFIVEALLITILVLWGYRFVNLRFHLFKRYELFVLILNLLSIWGLAKTIQDAFSAKPFLTNFDEWSNAFVVSHVGPVLQSISAFISYIGGTGVTLSIGLIVGIAFLINKKWRRAMIMIVSVVSTSAVVLILKGIVGRIRPENGFYILTDSSFPSGHAALSAALLVALVYISIPHIQSWVKRELIIVSSVLIVVIIGLSRIMLNVHWTSDVIAGWCLGVFLSTSSILFIRYVGALFVRKDK